jgi:hypothetical protein
MAKVRSMSSVQRYLAIWEDLRIWFTRSDSAAQTCGQCRRPVIAIHIAGQGIGVEVSSALGKRRDRDVAGVDALCQAGALVVGEERQAFVAERLASQSPAELVLPVSARSCEK